MPPAQTLRVRDEPAMTSLNPTMTSLLIALIVLVCTGLSLVAALFLLRSYRKSKQCNESPRVHNAPAKRFSNHRRFTVSATIPKRPSQSVYSVNEKEAFVDESPSPTQNTVPEIRITFPEEEDGSGKRKSGRVVVVRISETGGVGLEPYHNDDLPTYDGTNDDKFHSLDLDRIGGLKELERSSPRF
ncbi:MAG: hypothetical protein LQ351_002467 [Letrouitia transgressa]|nr:MAG: hypothetical protein LQ351_002467 [Letrouitia transgressa]